MILTSICGFGARGTWEEEKNQDQNELESIEMMEWFFFLNLAVRFLKYLGIRKLSSWVTNNTCFSIWVKNRAIQPNFNLSKNLLVGMNKDLFIPTATELDLNRNQEFTLLDQSLNISLTYFTWIQYNFRLLLQQLKANC